MSKKIESILKSVFVIGLFVVSASALAVWVAPTAIPPSNNATPPINTSGTIQTKAGSLTLNGLLVQAASALGLTDFTSSQSTLPVVSITNNFVASNSTGLLKALSVLGASTLNPNPAGIYDSTAGYFKGGNITVPPFNGANIHSYGLWVDEGVGVNTGRMHAAYFGGDIKIVDGTQGAGKVLTSDANGVASWATPAAQSGSNDWTANGGDLYTTTATRLGIGTNSPSQAIDVSGNIKASGGICVGGNPCKSDLTECIVTTPPAPNGYITTSQVRIATVTPGAKSCVSYGYCNGFIEFPSSSPMPVANTWQNSSFASSGTATTNCAGTGICSAAQAERTAWTVTFSDRLYCK